MKFTLISILLAGAAVSAHSETIQEFNNGCTRTCTGTWSYNPNTQLHTCAGTAGPLQCTGEMGHTPLFQYRSGGLDPSVNRQGTTFDGNGRPAVGGTRHDTSKNSVLNLR